GAAGALAAGVLLPLDEDLDRFGSGADQTVADPPPEAASVGHQVQGLEHAALAAAVGTRGQIKAARRRAAATFEAAQVADFEAGHPHRRAPAKAERPDQAGRSRSTWNPVAVRPVTGVAASPRGGTYRWSLPAPGRRSWHPATAGSRSPPGAPTGHPAGS